VNTSPNSVSAAGASNTSGVQLGVMSGAQAIVEYVRREIALGRLAPGDKLPAERQFAAQLGVARETLRHAFRMLESAGELDIRRGSAGGAFVREQVSDQATVLAWLRAQREQVHQLIEFRQIVESAAARLAAEHVSDELVHELDEANALLENADSVAESRRADTLFHLAIARGSGNDLLVSAIEDARVRMFEPVDGFAAHFIKHSSLDAHQAIRNAIAGGDAHTAQQLMVEHLMTTATEFERLIETRTQTNKK